MFTPHLLTLGLRAVKPFTLKRLALDALKPALALLAACLITACVSEPVDPDNSSAATSSAAPTPNSSSANNPSSANIGPDLVKGEQEYDAQCAACHDKGGVRGVSTAFGATSHIINAATGQFACEHTDCTKINKLKNYIIASMPLGPVDNCIGDCARNTAAFIATFDRLTPASSASSVSSSGGENVVYPYPGNALNGATIYEKQCQDCHGVNGHSGAVNYPLTPGECSTCSDPQVLIKKIIDTMPTPGACVGECAIDVATYVKTFTSPVSVTCNNNDIKPGHSPMRRLNKRQYANSLKDLLGVDVALATDFPDENILKGFDTNEDGLDVSGAHVEAFEVVAKKVAIEAVKKLNSAASMVPASGDQCNSTPDCKATYGNTANDCKNSAAANSVCMCGGARCDASSPTPPAAGDALLSCATLDNACAHGFINDFGQKAFRRPLTNKEKNSLKAIFAAGKQATDFKGGIQLVLETILQSPAFIYRAEFGASGTLNNGVVQLTSWEMASRLSYMFWATTPDDILMDLAQQNKLRTKAQIRAQAERLLNDERAKPVIRDYYTQWLGIGDIGSLERTPADYPGFTANTPNQLRRETEAFIDHVFWDGTSTLDELLTADYTFANNNLAEFYGITKPGTNNFVKVNNPGKNFGLLSQGSLMATGARPDETAPILRSVFVLEKVMCVHLATPDPTEVNIVFPPQDASVTTRERWTQTTGSGNCFQCHRILNPAGFIFENYDPVGRWRDEENNLPIDSSGELIATDSDGTFTGLADLSQALAQSDQVTHCAVTSWANYAYGRHIDEVGDDHCSMEQAYEAFSTKGKNLKELLVELTQTHAFMYRNEVN
ncbi:DUF1592 domain-containing protein [Marinagarivorans algicola]|uniref:DUF1592 domain-containing protein n=1 Tax=Marinagarivorans algicola TaxID=1513270 RepID=UPI00373529CD